MTARFLLLLGVAALSSSPAISQELAPPSTWRWIPDAPARLTAGQEVSDSTFWFVGMPPGWHITTGPGSLFFDPRYSARERFTIESELILFPGDSQGEYGIFLGGRDLGEGAGSYAAFVLRRDGSAAVVYHEAGTDRFIVPWASHDAVKAHPGDGTVSNVIAVVADGPDISFRVNGIEVAALSRDMTGVDGMFGFRIGAGMNLHITSLDLTERLALPRPKLN